MSNRPRFKNAQHEMQWLGVLAAGEAAVAAFDRMLEAGESVPMAAMLAVRRAPTAGICDRVVMANTPSVAEQFRGCEPMLELYRKNYRAQTGEDLPADAVVYRGLAQYPGDPGAIVTHKRPLSEVKRIMQERNCRVEGDWEVHPRPQEPKPRQVRMSEFAMQEYERVYQETGEFEGVDKRDMRAEILHRHAAPDVSATDLMNAPVIQDASKPGAIREAARKIPFGGRKNIELKPQSKNASSGKNTSRRSRQR